MQSSNTWTTLLFSQLRSLYGDRFQANPDVWSGMVADLTAGQIKSGFATLLDRVRSGHSQPPTSGEFHTLCLKSRPRYKQRYR